MAAAQYWVGIDLGTTNSTAAVFDGEHVVSVRGAGGQLLTPSVVRINPKGTVQVGARARRFLETDPDNTKSEFKRLMGTEEQLRFPGANLAKKPEELAAEVLRVLRGDIEEQFGFAPTHAVISVPALFELPQSSATAEAARLAGFDRVELLQEPIASALAAGWTAEDSSGTWLVFDLGGGTFDASLLETRDGLLRVVGHDGDNFLGGRDLDRAVVEWAIEKIASEHEVHVDVKSPGHAGALRQLRVAAEEAKIELSRARRAALQISELNVGGQTVEIDLSLSRETLEALAEPLISRALDVCHRLLETHGVLAEDLARIVLVGGPTVTPYVRSRVSQSLSARLSAELDPMSLVSHGAALYAMNAGLPAQGVAPDKTYSSSACKVWLQYPSVSSDLLPHVMGKFAESSALPASVQLVRPEDGWSSPDVTVSDERAFIVSVELLARRPNVFNIVARDESGAEVEVEPSTLTIVQGVSLSDPPLSRTVGVALANDTVQVYFERGTPLPSRRTFTHLAVDSVVKGSEACVLRIPIVQGEYTSAHLCRLVGALEISGSDVQTTIPAGSDIELTIELDRGGRLAAHARVPATNEVFQEVARLLVPSATLEVLHTSLESMRSRSAILRSESLRTGATGILGRLGMVEKGLLEVIKDLDALEGGDADAGQRGRRTLLELEAQLDGLETQRQWPELEEEAKHKVIWAGRWVGEFGMDPEVQLFEESQTALEEARYERDPEQLQRHVQMIQRLGSTCFYRHPEAWQWMFDAAVSEIDRASNLPRAQQLANEGREAISRDDRRSLERIVKGIWRLLPADAKAKHLSFDSGVR